MVESADGAAAAGFASCVVEAGGIVCGRNNGMGAVFTAPLEERAHPPPQAGAIVSRTRGPTCTFRLARECQFPVKSMGTRYSEPGVDSGTGVVGGGPGEP